MSALVSFIVAASYPLIGILLPGAILILSFLLTWMLFKRFSKQS